MPRLNIYIPADLHYALDLYRDRLNLSEICVNAIRSEMRSLETGVAREQLPGGAEWSRSEAEAEIARRFDLRVVRVAPGEPPTSRDSVATSVADFLDALVRDGMQIAIGGGPQLAAVVRALRPRNVRVQISAIGFGHVDREVPHVHANALVTAMSLLYARSSVTLVGDPLLRERWPLSAGGSGNEVMRMIIGGCGRWAGDSALARVLGDDIRDVLVEKKVLGDYLGVFLDEEARPVEPYLPSAPVSNIGSAALYAYARRADTLVVLVASAFLKIRTIKRVLKARLCNALILDEHTASVLISHARAGIDQP